MAHPKHPLETSSKQTGIKEAISQLTDLEAGFACSTARLTVDQGQTRIELFNGQRTPEIEITVFIATGITQICQYIGGKKVCEVRNPTEISTRPVEPGNNP